MATLGLNGSQCPSLQIINEPFQVLRKLPPNTRILPQNLQVISNALVKTVHRSFSRISSHSPPPISTPLPKPKPPKMCSERREKERKRKEREKNALINSAKRHPIKSPRVLFLQALLEPFTDKRVGEMRGPAIRAVHDEKMIDPHEAVQGEDVVDGVRCVAA
jgi:hypothetical protein